MDHSRTFVDESLFHNIPTDERRRFEWGFFIETTNRKFESLENDSTIQAMLRSKEEKEGEQLAFLQASESGSSEDESERQQSEDSMSEHGARLAIQKRTKMTESWVDRDLAENSAFRIMRSEDATQNMQQQRTEGDENIEVITDCDEGEISLTSIISEDSEPDKGRTAKCIVAEEMIRGEPWCLVQWLGYTIMDATWEPRDHFSRSILDQWEHLEKLQQRGEAERFDLARWNKGWKASLKEQQYQREVWRNKRHKQLGLSERELSALEPEKRIQQIADSYPKTEWRDDESLEESGSETQLSTQVPETLAEEEARAGQSTEATARERLSNYEAVRLKKIILSRHEDEGTPTLSERLSKIWEQLAGLNRLASSQQQLLSTVDSNILPVQRGRNRPLTPELIAKSNIVDYEISLFSKYINNVSKEQDPESKGKATSRSILNQIAAIETWALEAENELLAIQFELTDDRFMNSEARIAYYGVDDGEKDALYPAHNDGENTTKINPRASSKPQLVCRVPGCHEQTLSRFIDLDRHYREIHGIGHDTKRFYCDHATCSYLQPFHHAKALRGHFYKFHEEDITSFSLTHEVDIEEKKAKDYTWWRCNECLTRVSVHQDGFACPQCQVECSKPRQEARRILRNEEDSLKKNIDEESQQDNKPKPETVIAPSSTVSGDLEKALNDLSNEFETKWRPLCLQYILSPQEDEQERIEEYERLISSLQVDFMAKLESLGSESVHAIYMRQQALTRQAEDLFIELGSTRVRPEKYAFQEVWKGPVVLVSSGVPLAPFRNFLKFQVKHAKQRQYKISVFEISSHTLIPEIMSSDWGLAPREVEDVFQFHVDDNEAGTDGITLASHAVWEACDTTSNQNGFFFLCGAASSFVQEIEDSILYAKMDSAKHKFHMEVEDARRFWELKKQRGQFISQVWKAKADEDMPASTDTPCSVDVYTQIYPDGKRKTSKVRTRCIHLLGGAPCPNSTTFQHPPTYVGEAKRDEQEASQQGDHQLVFDPEKVAKRISIALHSGSSPDTGTLTEILPTLTHDQIMAVRNEYAKLMDGDSKADSTSLAMRIAGGLHEDVDPGLRAACFVTALGRWESECYWAGNQYPAEREGHFLLMEALLGRRNVEIDAIKEAFANEKYDDDLLKFLNDRLEEDDLKYAIWVRLTNERIGDTNEVDESLVKQDVQLMKSAGNPVHARMLLDIFTIQSDTYIRHMLEEFDEDSVIAYNRDRVHRDRLPGSEGLVVSDTSTPQHLSFNSTDRVRFRKQGIIIEFLMDGAISRPRRDARRLHRALSAPLDVPFHRDLLTARLVRCHWDADYMIQVRKHYLEDNKRSLKDDIMDKTTGAWGVFCRKLCGPVTRRS